jgi:DNA-binding MarR family transcriptional regulator
VQRSPTNIGALLFTVNRLEYLFTRLVERTMRNLDLPITPEEAQVMMFGQIFAASSVTELSRVLMRDRTTVTRLVASLEKKGFVKRVQDEQDRRIQRVSLTPLGVESLKRYVPEVKGRVDRLVSHFEASEVDGALRLLRELQRLIAQELVAMGDEPPLDVTEWMTPPPGGPPGPTL